MDVSESHSHVSYSRSPSRPKFIVPHGACDTHFHVIGADEREERSPTAPGQAPDITPWSDLESMHAALGIERGVLVQNTVVVRNYDVLVDSLRARPHLRGVALVDDTTTDDDLWRLDEGGVRGARFHFASYMLHHRSSWDVFMRVVDRLAPLGWHVVIHVDPSNLAEQGNMLKALPVDVVIDNMGNPQIGLGEEHSGLDLILALQQSPNIWIKITNFDRLSRLEAPGYTDARPYAEAIIQNSSDRLIWGTDWPHALYKSAQDETAWPPVDDGGLLDFLHAATPDAETFRKILVDNPARLYGFPEVEGE